MGIQRYSASLDTTISNAYEMNLRTRATGSNMGLADTLEVFSIYGQAASSSSEHSRILVQFPVTDMTADRTAGTIPASGSVNFFLRMYNAEHPFTVPKDYNLNIIAISGSWEEGYGLDMDEYSDLTYDDVGANWINAASGSAAIATIPDAIDTTGLLADRYNDASFTISISTAAGGLGGTAITFLLDASESTSGTGGANQIMIGTDDGITDAARAALIISAINAVTDSKVNYATSGNGQAGYDIGVTAKQGSSDTQITLTMDTAGTRGNVTSAIATASGLNIVKTGSFTSGSGSPWATAGGDYYTDYSPSSFTASFSNGTENLEVDITTLVEQWMNSTGNVLRRTPNHGVGIKFFAAQEASPRSYYTKKFFARGSQYHLKRPVIEARWDSSTKDNAGNFFLSSSLATATENTNTIYLYNNIRGQLRNIPGIVDVPGVGAGPIFVSIYSASYTGSGAPEPVGSKLVIPRLNHDPRNAHTNISGGLTSTTGVYSASFVYNSSSITKIIPVWHSGSTTASDVFTSIIEYYTGSVIEPKTFNAYGYNPHPSYVSKITNLKEKYSPTEGTTRFRIYAREKGWNPNIYNKASSDVATSIIEDGYYKVYRTIDEFQVVGYGTGSTNHTRFSYDTSGSYFDFPVDILAPGYMYAFKLLYKMPDGNYREQPEIFKFRVD